MSQVETIATCVTFAEWRKTRAYLDLADAMQVALRQDVDGITVETSGGSEEGSLPIKRRAVFSRSRTGLRFQRCGGGCRVVRRARGNGGH